MTPKQALDTLEGAEHHGSLGEAGDTLLALIRRDWDVRVLDAWVDSRDGRGQWQLQKLIGFGLTTYSVLCTGRDSLDLQHEPAPTADAARHSAALDVLPTLSAEKQAELGECP